MAAKKSATAKSTSKEPFIATVTFAPDKETAGTFRYKEVDTDGNIVENSDAVIGTLYIRKSSLKGRVPESITVTLTETL